MIFLTDYSYLRRYAPDRVGPHPMHAWIEIPPTHERCPCMVEVPADADRVNGNPGGWRPMLACTLCGGTGSVPLPGHRRATEQDWSNAYLRDLGFTAKENT